MSEMPPNSYWRELRSELATWWDLTDSAKKRPLLVVFGGIGVFAVGGLFPEESLTGLALGLLGVAVLVAGVVLVVKSGNTDSVLVTGGAITTSISVLMAATADNSLGTVNYGPYVVWGLIGLAIICTPLVRRMLQKSRGFPESTVMTRDPLPTGSDVVARLTELVELHERGHLTDLEFQELKRKLLS